MIIILEICYDVESSYTNEIKFILLSIMFPMIFRKLCNAANKSFLSQIIKYNFHFFKTIKIKLSMCKA